MKKCIRVMKALSDPTRVKIVKVLGHKGLCVCELTALLGLAQSTVSKHLKLLEDAGLVSSSREGAWVNYCLADGQDSPYAQAMLAHLGQWLDDDDEVRQILAEIPQVDRERIKVA
ncbi:MAG: metalloregulator ArsR/SmtB family transcription factor [Desulfurivibrionaceae bacterium]|nr:metalloregulator ArsR/SmtB family transcription factor [Desulfurivibrionaceae bacterium]